MPADPIRTRDVPAVTRAAAILRLLARSGSSLGVQAIARELSIVPSTCLHILRALVQEELVSFDPQTKRYAIGSGVVALARGLLRKDAFSHLAQPVLDELSAAFGATVIGVGAPSLDHMVVLALARPVHSLGLQVDIGSRYPALISATGRCIAAFSKVPPAEAKRRFHALRWDNPPDFDDWLADVAETARLGYAVDEGRYIRGVTVIAAPVIVGGRVTHAIAAVGVSEQLRQFGFAEIGQRIRREANDLATRLGA